MYNTIIDGMEKKKESFDAVEGGVMLSCIIGSQFMHYYSGYLKYSMICISLGLIP